MDLFTVLFAVSFCSLIHSYAQAGVCQDNDSAKCSQYAGLCRYTNVKQRCSLTCKQCAIATPSAPSSFSPSPASSPTSSLSSSLSSSVSMTSSSNLSPTRSAVVVLKSSVGGNEVNRNRNTTATASASNRDLQHAKMLMSIGFLCCYIFSSR